MRKPKPSQRQRSILVQYDRERPRILILEGAVRSGKTWVNNYLFYKMLKMCKGMNALLTGHTVGSIKRNVLEPMNSQFGMNIKLTSTDSRVPMFGNNVYCFGADKADSYKAMTGMTADIWYGNEITLQHENSIQEAFQRTSGDDSQIFWDTNPDYPHHPIKRNYIDHSGERLSDGSLWIQSWHFQIDDNPNLDPMYVESLKKSTPEGMWYDRKIKGLWVAAEGLVYEGWRREYHVQPPFDIPDDWKRVRSIDFGFNNPFVCLWGAIDPDGRLYIYDEHYQDHVLIKDHAEAIHSRPGNFAWTVADHDAQERAELEDKGIYTLPAQKAVAIGLQKVAKRLIIQGDGKPRLIVFDTCKNVIREIEKYAWAANKSGMIKKEEPVKADDHAMDALRYMIMEIDGGGFVLV